MEIGEFIKIKRKEKKISLRELASKIEISHPYLSQIENNLRKASPELLDKISPIIDVSHNELMKIAGFIHEPKGIEKTFSDYKETHYSIHEITNQMMVYKEQIGVNQKELEGLKKQQNSITENARKLNELSNSPEVIENTAKHLTLVEEQLSNLKTVTLIKERIMQLEESNVKMNETLGYMFSKKGQMLIRLKELKDAVNDYLEKSYNEVAK